METSNPTARSPAQNELCRYHGAERIVTQARGISDPQKKKARIRSEPFGRDCLARPIPDLSHRSTPYHVLPRPACLALLQLLQPVHDAKELKRSFWNRLLPRLPALPTASRDLDLPRRFRNGQAEFVA
jgi:hypothetical protein